MEISDKRQCVSWACVRDQDDGGSAVACRVDSSVVPLGM